VNWSNRSRIRPRGAWGTDLSQVFVPICQNQGFELVNQFDNIAAIVPVVVEIPNFAASIPGEDTTANAGSEPISVQNARASASGGSVFAQMIHEAIAPRCGHGVHQDLLALGGQPQWIADCPGGDEA
jgi:hypothetical protein